MQVENLDRVRLRALRCRAGIYTHEKMDELILKLCFLDAHCLLRAVCCLPWVLRALCELRVAAPYWIITKAACDKYHTQ